MSKSFQNEVPPSRINIKLDLHTGGAQKKVELPLKLLVTGDYSKTNATLPKKKKSISTKTTLTPYYLTSTPKPT